MLVTGADFRIERIADLLSLAARSFDDRANVENAIVEACFAVD
jgi:hypothetical protein